MSQSRERPMVTRSLPTLNRWREPSALSMVISDMERREFYPADGHFTAESAEDAEVSRRALHEASAFSASSAVNGPLRVRRGPGLGALEREVALAHADLQVLALGAQRDGAEGAVGRALGGVGQQVVLVQLLRDGREHLVEVAHALGEEELAARLAGDPAQEAAGTAAAAHAFAADADRVDRRLHRPGVVHDLLLLHLAGGVLAVREDDHRLAALLVADAVQPVVD